MLTPTILVTLCINHCSNNVICDTPANSISFWRDVGELFAAPGSVPMFLALPHREIFSVHNRTDLALLTSSATNGDRIHTGSLLDAQARVFTYPVREWA